MKNPFLRLPYLLYIKNIIIAARLSIQMGTRGLRQAFCGLGGLARGNASGRRVSAAIGGPYHFRFWIFDLNIYIRGLPFNFCLLPSAGAPCPYPGG
jgi:hypothetical protein